MEAEAALGRGAAAQKVGQAVGRAAQRAAERGALLLAGGGGLFI